MGVKRIGSVASLRPGMELAYRRLHAQAWPEVLENLRTSHIRCYSIFVSGSRLFSYREYDGVDYQGDMDALAALETTQRWRSLAADCLLPGERPAGTTHWTDLDEVFHYES